MAIEVMQLQVMEDDSEEIIVEKRYFGNEQEVFDFLPETDLMLTVDSRAKNLGVLINNPNVVGLRLFERVEDTSGIDVTGCDIVHMVPGQELYVRSLIEDKEIWVVNDYAEDRAPAEPPLVLAGI